MESLGQHLKKRREEKGISLEDISRVTKINLSYLKDMEEERFDQLPAPIFTVGFLKQYAQCIGLDPEDVVLRYRLAVEKDTGFRREDSQEKSWVGRRRSFWVVAGCVCGLVLLWIFLYPGTKNGGERVRSIRLPRSSSTEMKKEELKKELEIQTDIARGSPPNSLLSAGEGEEPVTNVGNGTAGNGPVAITLQALRETWVQVTLDEQTSELRVMKKGDRFPFQAERKIHLKIGNGNGVRIFYNGKAYESLGQKGEVVHIVFPPPES